MKPSGVLRVPFFPALIAGIGAGAVAGLVNIGLLSLMHARLPPAAATGGSSVVAGAFAGIAYWMLARIFPRPAAALWLTSFLIATVDTLVVFTLPFPTAGRRLGLAPLAGLVTPVLQILALFGVGGSAPVHLPGSAQPAYLVVHYATAVVVSLLIPIFARPSTRSI
ncbi:MAG TPA: hypothetical protein VKW09_05025 [bacterium]|nr:hypothetical protein [bacterium]